MERQPGWRELARIGGVAYLFASLFPLLWILWDEGGWVEGDTTVFRVTSPSRVLEAVGLTYRGASGSILLWAELLCVSAALILSMRARPLVRRIAHGLLIVWAAILCSNVWWIVLAADLEGFKAALVVVTLGMLLVVGRALAGQAATGSQAQVVS